MKLSEVIAKLNRKEWWLPPFQRDFVWNEKIKVIKFVDSLYRWYPIGSVTIWKPHIKDIEEMQRIREKIGGRPISAPASGEPVWSTEYILDGQQRLTTISRIFAGAPFVFGGEEHILHFDIKNEEFWFLKKGSKEENLIPFHEIINKTNKELIADLDIDDKEEIIRITSLFDRVRKIQDRELNFEITDPLKKQDALELFIRFNTGGKPLATENLALGYISIKWHAARDEFESFRKKLQTTGFGFDFDFFIRCLSAVSLGQSLTKKIVDRFEEKTVEKDWKKTKRGIEKLIDFLKGELNIHSNRFIEAENTLVPLVLLFTKKDVVGKERSLLSFAFIVSYLNRRYSGGKFKNLDTDIKMILKKDNPVEDWVKTLEKERETLKKLKPSEMVETPNRTLELPLFILLRNRGVTRDLLGRSLIDSVAAEEDRPEFHHIFPQKCLEGTRFEEKTHHIANLTLITSKSNKIILSKKPNYLCDVEDELKEQHFIPKDKKLYKINRYEDFLRIRQELIAKELNRFLEERKRILFAR
jgi:hypothetical protein